VVKYCLNEKKDNPVSSKNYLTWISQNFPSYVGNWPPTQTLTLGSVGTVGPDGFIQYSTINLRQQESKNAQMSIIADKTTIDENLQDSTVNISFKDENAFVMQATDVSSIIAADLTAVKEAVAQKLNNGDWDPSWYVVVGLQLASNATIIVSGNNDASLVLSGTIGVPLPLAGKAQLKIASQKGASISFLTIGYPVLMYKALKVKEAWFIKSPSVNFQLLLAVGFPAKKELPEMEELQLKDILSLIK
jgi:hypothetical protein